MNNLNPLHTVVLNLTIKAALELLTNTRVSKETRDEVKKCIVDAWAAANPEFANMKPETRHLNMTLKTVNPEHKIRCIAAVKNNLGWNLKEAKDFVENVMGKEQYYGDGIFVGGGPQTLTGLRADVLSAVDSLRAYGCEVVTDTWGCEDTE